MASLEVLSSTPSNLVLVLIALGSAVLLEHFWMHVVRSGRRHARVSAPAAPPKSEQIAGGGAPRPGYAP